MPNDQAFREWLWRWQATRLTITQTASNNTRVPWMVERSLCKYVTFFADPANQDTIFIGNREIVLTAGIGGQVIAAMAPGRSGRLWVDGDNDYLDLSQYFCIQPNSGITNFFYVAIWSGTSV